MVFPLLFSCEKESEDLSKEVGIVEFTINGDNPVVQKSGIEFVEPGVTAIEIKNGDTTELTDIKTITSFDKDLGGAYDFQYSVVSSDGITYYSDNRTVIVYDDEISGVYNCVGVRNGTTDYSAEGILIYKIADGIYKISDWIGGFYATFYDYGPGYAFPGNMKIAGSGAISYKSHSDPWGYAGDINEEATVNADGTISYVFQWAAGYDFDIVLTKQ